MARVLDLNKMQSSILDITLQDKNRTVVHLDLPTESLVQELEALIPELDGLKKGDRAAINEIYDVAAKLINCNLDCFHVTAQELYTVYGMNILSAINFFSAYFDTIEALANEKN